MDLKLFTDLIDALDKVVTGLGAVAALPKAERDRVRQVLDDTHRLVDTALNMIILRLGDILRESDADFLREAAVLDNQQAWIQAEREFRLCKAVRIALREMQTIGGRITGALAVNDWNALLTQMSNVLRSESELADFIGASCRQLAQRARYATSDPGKVPALRIVASVFRDALIAERQRLIAQEITLYTQV